MTTTCGEMITARGRVVDVPGECWVHMTLEAGQTIAPHQHEGQWVTFLVVAGCVQVTLARDEQTTTYEATPGSMIRFEGECLISALALARSDVFVALVERKEVL